MIKTIEIKDFIKQSSSASGFNPVLKITNLQL